VTSENTYGTTAQLVIHDEIAARNERTRERRAIALEILCGMLSSGVRPMPANAIAAALEYADEFIRATS
jgi:hypothetical protein